MNSKKIVTVVTLITLTGTSCWGASCENLIDAAKKGDMEKLNQALNNKDCAKTRDLYGFTPLMWAADYADEDVATTMVTALIENANSKQYVNAKSKDGFTALSQAAIAGNEKVVQDLINAGADTKEALFEAVKNQHRPENESVAIINSLKQHHINMNETDNHDWTPLMWAALRGKLTVVDALLQNGANKKLTNNDHKTALDIALNAGHYDIVSALQK